MKSICDVCGEKLAVGDSIYVSKDHKIIWCKHLNGQTWCVPYPGTVPKQ